MSPEFRATPAPKPLFERVCEKLKPKARMAVGYVELYERFNVMARPLICMGFVIGRSTDENKMMLRLGLGVVDLLMFPPIKIVKTFSVFFSLLGRKDQGYMRVQLANRVWTMRPPWHPHTVKTEHLMRDGTWKTQEPRMWVTDEEKAWFETPTGCITRDGEYQSTIATIRRTRHHTKWLWFGGRDYDNDTVIDRLALRASNWLRRKQGWSRISDSIDVRFRDEMGTQRGSWKGGTIGISFTMLPGERSEETLRRCMKTAEFR